MTFRNTGAKLTARRGMSTIEMVTVVLLLSLGSLVGLPKFRTVTTHMRVNQAAMLVAGDLSLAATNAARERRPMRIALGADGQSITVTDRTSGTVLLTRRLGPQDAYRLDALTLSATPVDIFPSGFTSSALVVTLTAGGYSRQVAMSRAGWARAL